MLYCARRCPQWRGWLWCFCESDTRCAVLQYRILLDRKSKWANESLSEAPSLPTLKRMHIKPSRPIPQRSIAQHSIAQQSAARGGRARHCMAQHGPARHSAAQRGTAPRHASPHKEELPMYQPIIH